MFLEIRLTSKQSFSITISDFLNEYKVEIEGHVHERSSPSKAIDKNELITNVLPTYLMLF
jgi:hypothetical protein